MKRRVPRALYYELAPSGHCPAHETPVAVAELLAHFALSTAHAAAAGAPPSRPLAPYRGLSVGEQKVVGTGRELGLQGPTAAAEGPVVVRLTDGRPSWGNPVEVLDSWVASLTAGGGMGA